MQQHAVRLHSAAHPTQQPVPAVHSPPVPAVGDSTVVRPFAPPMTAEAAALTAEAAVLTAEAAAAHNKIWGAVKFWVVAPAAQLLATSKGARPRRLTTHPTATAVLLMPLPLLRLLWPQVLNTNQAAAQLVLLLLPESVGVMVVEVVFVVLIPEQMPVVAPLYMARLWPSSAVTAVHHARLPVLSAIPR